VPDQQAHGPANWYGWQTLIAVAPFDIAMFVGLARSGTSGATEAVDVGFVGRTLAPAVVHMAHQRWSTAFGSMGLHAATTGTGLAIGFAIGLALQGDCPPRDPCRNHFRDLPLGPGYGAIAGSMTGTVLDTIFFTYRQRLTWTASAPVEPARRAWAIAPYATRGGVGIAAGGTL